MSAPTLLSAALIADWIVPCVHGCPGPEGEPTVKIAACAVAQPKAQSKAAPLNRRVVMVCLLG